MRTSAVEVLAAILIAVTVVKLVVILVNAQAWFALTKSLYARPMMTSVVSMVLAGLVLAVLVDAGLTIVQILAVCVFVVLLLIPGFAPYVGEIVDHFKDKPGSQILKEQWLYSAVWVALLGWGAYELLLH